MHNVRPIALTMGDPASIGPDITLMSWLRREVDGVPPFAFIGDPDVLHARSHQLGLNVPLATIDQLSAAAHLFSQALPIIPVAVPEEVAAGRPSAAQAEATIRAIELGVKLVVTGKASVIVTNPIAKHIMANAGFTYPGHTEFLGALARNHAKEATPIMMLCGPGLRVVPVTIHIPLAKVPGMLTTRLIVQTAQITAAGLRRFFGIHRPRLAITGLNPHAGENGMMGDEEMNIIAPAIVKLRAAGFNVSGPHSADALFHAAARKNYDAAIAMYHDQALIPLKTLAFDQGVNVTLGLPFIRTSPDHGTAFDIAGTGKARPDSLIAALRLAAQMAGQHLEQKALPA